MQDLIFKTLFLFFLEYKFIKSKKPGYAVLLYKNFTYRKTRATKKGTRWVCSSSSSKNCSARVFLNDNGTLIDLVSTHSHSAPKFYVDKDGQYVRI